MKRKETVVMLSFLMLLGFVGAAARAQSLGNAFAIANTANEEMSGGAAFDGTNYLVGIQGDATAHYDITAQLVSPAGALVGPRISVGRTGGTPWVAFDGTNYLMVWSDDAVSHPDDPLYGVFVSPSGSLVGSPFAISVGVGDHEPQGMAFDGTNYLVLYSDAQSSPFNLCGRFVSRSGPVGDEFVLASNAAGAFQAAAWNGSTYFVAWPAHIGGNQNIVQGRTVSTTGAMSDLLTIDGTISLDQNPLSVATDGTNFLVVWNYDASVDGQGNAIWELRGRVVTPAGGFLGAQFTVADTSTRPFFPAVAFDGATYLVAWTAHSDSGDLDVIGRYFSSNGTPAGDAFGIAVGSGNQGISPILFGGGKYLVVWTDGLGIDPSAGITGGDVLGAFFSPLLGITTQPTPQTVTAGGNATFTVAASGNPSPGYRWQVSTDSGSTWTDLTNTAPYGGVTTATLTVAGATAALSRYQFRCVVSNSVGSVNSNGAVLRVAPATLTLGGGDDFASSANWSAPTRPAGVGGRLTFTNGRLEYTVNPPSSSDTVFREWTANVGSSTQDWAVQVDVHLASLSLANAQHANLNLVVVNAADATNSIDHMDRMTVAIDRYGDGSTTGREFEGDVVGYYAGTAHDTGLLDVPNSATDAALRITFNSATKELSSWYDADGAAGGYNWTLLQKVNISSGTYTWDMTDSSTFAMVLAGGSGGVALSSGDAYFDNFQAATGGVVYPPIVITVQPEAQNVTAGGNATFTVAASGNPTPGYAWQVSTDGGSAWTDLTDTAPYSGVTTATLTVTGATTALSRYQFRAVASNGVDSANSDAALLRVAPTTLNFSGSDDLSTTAHWSAPTLMAGEGARLTFTNNRLEYTVGSPSADDRICREWTANVGSYTRDWAVQVDVHFASLSLSDGPYANLNLVVVNAADATHSTDQMDRMSVAIDRYGNGSTTVHNFEGRLIAYYAGTAHDTGLLEVPDSATDAALRITFNSATKELTSWYMAGGTAGGYNWTVLQTLNIGSGTYTWDMNDSSTFAVVLAGGSGGLTLSSGQAYFSNFQATTAGGMLHDWNGDGIVNIIGDVPPFVDAVYFQKYPEGWSQEKLLEVGDCNHDGILSIIGDVPCFVDCVYFQKGCP